MARGGNCESGIPFMKPEDLHVWLISFALLMVLTSSLSFASAQFSPAGDPLWIDFGKYILSKSTMQSILQCFRLSLFASACLPPAICVGRVSCAFSASQLSS